MNGLSVKSGLFSHALLLAPATPLASSLLVGVQPQKLGSKQARCESYFLPFSLAYQHLQQVRSIEQADSIRIVPEVHRGKGEIVPLIKKDAKDVSSYTFNYQRDTYSVAKCSSDSVTFIKLPYPSSGNPSLNSFLKPQGPKFGLSSQTAEQLKELYGLNEFNIPIPSFTELFSEHATAPFFVFQACLDFYPVNDHTFLNKILDLLCRTMVPRRVLVLQLVHTIHVGRV